MDAIVCHAFCVHQQQMGLRTTADNAEAMFGQFLRQPLRVVHNAPLQSAELIGLRQLQGYPQRGYAIQVRPALLTGENGAVNFGSQLFAVRQDHCPTWPAQALVRGSHHHVCNANGRGVYARCYQPGNVRNVSQQIRTHLVANGPESRPIHNHRVSGKTGDDDLRLRVQGATFDVIVVQQFSLGVYKVLHAVVMFAGAVDFGAM